MSIALSAESTIDLQDELLEKFKINTVPFSILIGEEIVLDGANVSQKIFDYVAKTKVLPKTSAVNQNQYEEHFGNLLKNNDEVVHISLSKEMSCAYQNAVEASKKFKGKVVVIDSQSLSTGIALLAIYARKLIDEGKSLKDIETKVKSRINFVQASFVLDKLNFLYKGGRCTSLQLLGSNLLKIKPEIIVENGKMKSTKKFFGLLGNVIKNYCDDILQKFNNPDLENVFITYSSGEQKSIDMLKETLKQRGFKNIYVTTAGGTISSHCGPGCLGVLYINDANNMQ